VTRFNKTGIQPTEKICGHYQLDYHKPEFTGVISVQSGVLPSQQQRQFAGPITSKQPSKAMGWTQIVELASTRKNRGQQHHQQTKEEH